MKGGKSKYGGQFKDEMDAAKRVNHLCEKFGMPQQNSIFVAIPNQQYQEKEKASQYNGVYKHKKGRKWYVQMCVKGQKRKYGGCFKDELDAAKRVNQLCEKLEIPLKNPTISAIPNQQYQKKGRISRSQYKGVTWHKQSGKWYVQMCLTGGKKKYGGSFKDELEAAKRVNQLCEELGIPPQNPTINAIPNQQYQKNEKTSQYKGVSWHRGRKRWYVLIYLKGQKPKYGGMFKDELDAAKRVNQLCEEFGIPPQNPTISAIPNEQCQKKEKTSQYKGVTWHKQRKKWYVRICIKGEEPKYGGIFKDELDAAKRANQLCEELGIPLQNPAISATPDEHNQKREKISQYKGVHWSRERKKWYVSITLKGGKKKYGGIFNDELEAAKRVNQLCEELGIPLKNTEIVAMPNQKYHHGEYQTTENPVISSEMLKIDNDDAKKKE